MSRFIILSLFMVWAIGCIRRPTPSSIVINGSDEIIITYHDLSTCMPEREGEIRIIPIGGPDSNYVFTHYTIKHKIFRRDSNRTMKDNDWIQDVKHLINKAKSEETYSCGGFAANGKGVMVRIESDGDIEQIFFCKDQWDGIGELLGKLRANSD